MCPHNDKTSQISLVIHEQKMSVGTQVPASSFLVIGDIYVETEFRIRLRFEEYTTSGIWHLASCVWHPASLTIHHRILPTFGSTKSRHETIVPTSPSGGACDGSRLSKATTARQDLRSIVWRCAALKDFSRWKNFCGLHSNERSQANCHAVPRREK